MYERLGDVRSVAVTKGKAAAILASRGVLDEALRIRTEEMLPVFERLGDVCSVAAARTNLAILLWRRGRPDDHAEADALITSALAIAEPMGLAVTTHIREWHARITSPRP